MHLATQATTSQKEKKLKTTQKLKQIREPQENELF